MYLIPKELKSKIKITRYFHLKEFLMFVGVMAGVFIFEDMIHSSLRYFYYIFYAGACGILLSKAKNNPGKNNLQAMILTLTKDRDKYYSMDSE